MSKPREFWVVNRFRNKNKTTTVYENKIAWRDLLVGDECIHVIEKYAYDKLAAELALAKKQIEILRDALDSIAAIGALPENYPAYFSESSQETLAKTCVTDTKIARKALRIADKLEVSEYCKQIVNLVRI